MARSATSMIQELGYRLSQFVLSNPTADGAADGSTLVDASLRNYMPTDIAQNNVWIYGSTGNANNADVERRARTWTFSTQTLTFQQSFASQVLGVGPGANDTYEVHLRHRRARILEALNSGVRMLDLLWYREFIDTSITTVQGQWAYTLPSSQNWLAVTDVQVQVSTDTTLVGFPYMSARPFNWKVLPSTTSAVQTLTLQFEVQPPPSRILKIFGVGYAADLTASSNLYLAGAVEGRALEWLYRWAGHQLKMEEAMRSPTFDAKDMMIAARVLSDEAEKIRERLSPTIKPGLIITPGQGDGQITALGQDARYFGAFSNPH